MIDMTTRRAIVDNDFFKNPPGRCALYAIASGKTDYFSVYDKMVCEGISR